MKVFKFGGASINSADRYKNTSNIIQSFSGQKILVVVSAMGKTTNALESVVHAYFEGRKDDAINLFNQVKQQHLETIKYLLVKNWQKAENQIKDFFTEIEWLLHDKAVRSFDYYYDQIVCCGELFSSSILSNYLEELNANVTWIDVRDIIRTDNNFRDAAIDWTFTEAKIEQSVLPLFKNNDIIITQGFIGATDENESTTLGREGSDFTAALFANMLNGESVTIWKDVEAVMSADPKKFPDAIAIQELSFTEVIEMAYYGAQVIHPKTIKPLQNKNIPLYVKSFLNPAAIGTTINGRISKNLPPIIVNKENQVLISFKTKDFSFIDDAPITQIQQLFSQIRIKPNLTQKTAISLLCCFDLHPEKVDQLAQEAAAYFDVELEKNLNLLTIRHFNEKSLDQYVNGKEIILEQKTTKTIQMLIR
jgi:aspartate kinase